MNDPVRPASAAGNPKALRYFNLFLILAAVAIYDGLIFALQFTSVAWYWMALILSLSTTGLFSLIVVAGILWSPVGALICAGIARRTQLNAMKYALAGATYSSVSMYLWLALLSSMDDMPFKIANIRYPLYTLFLLWLLGPITMLAIFSKIHLADEASIYGWVYLSLWLTLLLLFAVSLGAFLSILSESSSDDLLTPKIPFPEWRLVLLFLGALASGLIVGSQLFWPD